jgi:hypothetical protein
VLFEIQTENTSVQVFRLRGKPVPSTQLSLRLEDFAPDRVPKPDTLTGMKVSLSSETLCHYLKLAEICTETECDGLQDSRKPWVRKRRRPTTPTEGLASRDEAAFRMREERTEAEAERADSSYQASSSSSEGP